MNTIQRIAKNTLALFSAQFFVSILSLLLSVYIARILGDVDFGRYSFALAFVTILAVFSDLGYNTLLIRDVARSRDQASKYLSNIISIRALLSLIIFFLIFIIINLMGYSNDTKNIIYLFGLYVILGSLAAVFRTTFRAFEKMEYEAAINIISEIVKVSLGLLVLFLGYGLMMLAVVFLITAIFNFIISFLVCEKKFVKSRTELDFDFFKSTIKIAFPLSLLSIFGLIYIRIDTVMLSVLKGNAVVGWYNASYNLVLSFKAVPHLLMNALLPLMSYYYISSKNLLKKTYEKSFKYLLILGLPVALGISLISDRIILLFYGEQFINSIFVLRILAWDVLLIFLCKCLAFLLVSTDKQNQMAIIVGLVALINVILNLFLIPIFSFVGAAMATIVAECFLLFTYMYLTHRSVIKISIHKIILKPVVACAAMGFFVFQFREINLLILVIISAVIYFGLLYLLKGISDDDISLFKRLIKK